MMTGNGYVLKVGSTIFPNALLAPRGYKNTPDRRQDKNSYTDGRGVTHRNILPVKRTTIKIKTIDELTYGQKLIVQSFFPNRDKVVCEVWNDEKNDYQTITAYVPDIEYTVKHIDKDGNFYYNAVEFELIDYGSE
jgi:hypothetical protein